MSNQKWWVVGALITLIIIIVPIAIFVPNTNAAKIDDPWAHKPEHPIPTDHTGLIQGPFESGKDVTKACLECHPEAGRDMLQNNHFTWTHGPYNVPGHEEPVYTGKKYSINNFCIAIKPNWPPCTACHAGYGWEDENFDFSDQTNIDCLVCHDTTGLYVKANSGYPAKSVDLVDVAKHVGNPNRLNCGVCHFRGGGGDAVKHGDLDNSLINPSDELDVHMGKYDFTCTDCHRYEGNHQWSGRSISVSLDDKNQTHCTDCHAEKPHEDDRLNLHTASVACQTCHIPAFARKEATKVWWDWSKAGDDTRPNNPHEYLKIKGEFIYEKNVTPEYAWYNGVVENRYLIGDKIDPTVETVLNMPAGSIEDPNAKIFPFKVHHAKQPYDKVYNILLTPKTYGKDGYWTDFEWDKAMRLGAEAHNIPYSGEYGFAPTAMYWPTTHMVAPKEEALQCNACHTPDGSTGRLDWKALGYDGDPMFFGSREIEGKVADEKNGGAQ